MDMRDVSATRDARLACQDETRRQRDAPLARPEALLAKRDERLVRQDDPWRRMDDRLRPMRTSLAEVSRTEAGTKPRASRSMRRPAEHPQACARLRRRSEQRVQEK